MKRLFDLSSALVLLLILAPVMAFVWIAVKVDSRGPGLFRQQRVGRYCEPFTMFKFRSMRMDAESAGGFRTQIGDTRITRVGKFIRRTSLDELPQLLNVLRGDMSLVGPRADVPAQATDYSEADWQRRHKVRPGITGLAQVNGRSAATPAQRLACDLDYVARHSVWLDIKIIFLTARHLLSRGAF